MNSKIGSSEKYNKSQVSSKKTLIANKNEPARSKVSGKNAPISEIKTKTDEANLEKKIVELTSSLTVKELADILKTSPQQIIKELLRNGIMATMNQSIDYDSAAIIASDLGFETSEMIVTNEEKESDELCVEEKFEMVKRPPVVTILGHVDHGKTSLLDAIRESNVMATEAGNITQHIGAYQVEKQGQKITFLDTPGHAAFTSMRARGAQVTDIAVLVVAADDGVMPQTLEAISHAKAAKVPIIVCINKIDKPGANPERVKQQLSEVGLLPEEWGGDTIFVEVSAKKRQGIDQLLEMILLVAEISELKAVSEGMARGVVIEAKLDKSRGPLATVLVQRVLKVGDCVVIGSVSGKVRAMFNDKGKNIRKALPSTPVEILGLSDVPEAGDIMIVCPDEKTARQKAAAKKQTCFENVAPSPFTLADISEQLQTKNIKELDLILKTDVQGSIEPIKESLERLSTDNVKIKVIHSGTGNVTESDILLAQASKAVIIAFNVKAEAGAKKSAEIFGIDIRTYDVIYNIIEDIEKALSGMLEPTYKDVIEGHAEVRKIFRVGKTQVIAGCYVCDGKICRSSFVRLKRNGEQMFDGKISGLKRIKDDVREVQANYECGITLEGFNDIQEGDIIVAYVKEKV